MYRRFRRFLIGFIAVILALCIIVGAVGVVLPRRSFPQINGDIRLTGLSAPVDVYRDAYGVPQIYAQNTHDLFFAQGYVHAQDRFWQMDFWRHIGQGRLSEMFGNSQLETDKTLRTMGWARVAAQEVGLADPQTKAILEAYAEGVNTYLKDHKGSALSLEYSVLGLLTPGYQPEPWTPLNTLTWAKAMAWDLGGNLDQEITRALLMKSLSPQQISDLFPTYPSDHPVIVPDFKGVSSENNTAEQVDQALAGQLSPTWQSLQNQFQALDGILGPVGADIGSNNWTISGKLTSTGKPMLANDPHLAAQMPSIWYEIGLHCTPKGDACPFEVTGFSFAGAPGVIVGHNDRIAWGVTNTNPDVQDLYIEKINPDNPNQYEVNGKWVDMQIIKETINIAKASPLDLTVRYTRHGPIISDTFSSLKDFNTKAGLSVPDHYAIAMHWTALEPNQLFAAVLDIDLAQNWDQFRKAASFWAAPAQNLVYADVDGNIGYQMPGLVPMRASGDGSLPVPGWTDQYEWKGYIPFEKLPSTFNPDQGFVVTANNAVVGSNYPYLITTGFDPGYRAQRITDMIKNAPGPITLDYIQKIQGDDKDLNAAILAPILENVSLNDANLEKTRQLLAGWDYEVTMDSAPAALWNAFWKHLTADTFDELPSGFVAGNGAEYMLIVENLVKQPDSAWWDEKSSDQVEKRDDIFRQAFKEAAEEMTRLQGADPSKWKWGDMHTLTLRNQSLGESGVGPIESIFNRGPFRTAGGSSIVNATGWDAPNGYQVVSLPSMRMIVDLSNLSNSLSVITTGESGHAYNSHYTDMTDMWRNIQYHPMLWNQDQAQQGKGGHLRLTP